MDVFDDVPAEGASAADPLTGSGTVPPPPPPGEGLDGYDVGDGAQTSGVVDESNQGEAAEVGDLPTPPQGAPDPLGGEPEDEQPVEEPPAEQPAEPPVEEPPAEVEQPGDGEAATESPDDTPPAADAQPAPDAEEGGKTKPRPYVLLQDMGDDTYKRLRYKGDEVILARSGEYAKRIYAAEVGEIDATLVAVAQSGFRPTPVKTRPKSQVVVDVG